MTNELVREFLSRLTCCLHFDGYVSRAEREATLHALKGDFSFPEISNELGQALLLKACLEFGRLRPTAPVMPFLQNLLKYVITVDQLLTHPIMYPLPIKREADPMQLGADSFGTSRAKARLTPEYHLAVALHYGDRGYWRAVEEISHAYRSLDDAFRSISKKGNYSDVEKQFISRYHDVAESI